MAGIAKILGKNDVHVLDNRWLKKMKEGVIVTVHIGRWRARAKLTYRDLGLPEEETQGDKVLEELLLLGEKFLLPTSYVRSLESADSSTRKYLTGQSFDTAYGPFVPFTRYAEVQKELKNYRSRYLAISADIVDNLESITGAHLETCREAARQAYGRLSKLKPGFKSSNDFIEEEEFVDKFLDSITALIPSKERLSASFVFDINVSYIPLPSLLEKDLADAERIRAEGKREAARIEAQEERLRAQRQLERLKEQGALSLEEAALRERERKLDEMNRDVLEQARLQKEELVTFSVP